MACAGSGCGLLFGLGLVVSGMANPAKILGFLDVAGSWDPTLLVVFASAVAVTTTGFALVRRLEQPRFATEFEAAPPERIDGGILAGAAIFGVGWGLCGYCPGPAIVSLGRLAPSAFIFVAAFVIGSFACRIFEAQRAPSVTLSLSKGER